MKQFILSGFIFTAFIIKATAQTDSLPNTDSVKEKLQAATISFKKYIEYEKEKKLFINPLYYPAEYRSNYSRYRYPETNSIQKSAVGVIGNILLSVLADKTNHAYWSAPF